MIWSKDEPICKKACPFANFAGRKHLDLPKRSVQTHLTYTVE